MRVTLAKVSILSLHDALPISGRPAALGAHHRQGHRSRLGGRRHRRHEARPMALTMMRSEEHTSELQSRRDLVCRLLLEKKKLNKLGYDARPFNQILKQNAKRE